MILSKDSTLALGKAIAKRIKNSGEPYNPNNPLHTTALFIIDAPFTGNSERLIIACKWIIRLSNKESNKESNQC